MWVFLESRLVKCVFFRNEFRQRSFYTDGLRFVRYIVLFVCIVLKTTSWTRTCGAASEGVESRFVQKAFLHSTTTIGVRSGERGEQSVAWTHTGRVSKRARESETDARLESASTRRE